MSPGVYLEQLVIQKACRLLIEEDKSMAQIAEELDFSDQFYFTKYFKRKMHMPPSASSLSSSRPTSASIAVMAA